MGVACTCIPNDSDDNRLRSRDINKEAPDNEEKKSEPKKQFVVRPFAVMRLAHEAVRSGIADIQAALQEVSDDCSNMENITQIYNDLEHCIVIHAQQEDDVFFPLLNEQFNNVISTEKIPSTHITDSELRQKISLMFDSGCDSKTELTLLINEWIEKHEAHLKLEEQIMMPLTKKTAETVEERGAIVRSIINVNRKEFSEFQFEYVLRQLVENKPFGPVMMYCKAAQMASNAEEYNEIKGKIAGIVGEDMWKKLQSKGVEQDGKQK